MALAIVVFCGLVAWYAARTPRDVPPAPAEVRDAGPARAEFDFYLLSMTLHDSFCMDHAGAPECRAGPAKPLVIHGLWPERLQPRAYPHDCPAPRLDLPPSLERELAELMPGMAQGLHEHEWREHGGCSGLDDDEYFRSTLALARALDAALGATLTTFAGREAGAAELRAAAEAERAGLGATLTFHCRARGGRPWLMEIRQCVDDDGPAGAPGTPIACDGVNRRDQGCGARFHIASAR